MQHQSQRRNQYLWISAALLAAALLIAVVMAWSRRDPPNSDPQQTARILARLQALEARLGETPAGDRQADAVTRPPMERSGPQRGESGIAAPPLPVLTPEQSEQQHRDSLQLLEAQFSNDAKDPVGGAVEGQLLEVMVGDAMRSTGLVPRDPDVDCRRHSCRIVGSFTSSGDAEDWVLTYMTASGGRLARARAEYVGNPDGSTQARIYAARAEGGARR